MDASNHDYDYRKASLTADYNQRVGTAAGMMAEPRDVNIESAFVRAEIVASQLDELVFRLDQFADRFVGPVPQDAASGSPITSTGGPAIASLHRAIDRASSRISYGQELLTRIERVLP